MTGVQTCAFRSHPDFRDLAPDLNCQAIAIVGNGNVALDVARLLAKTRAELASTDLPDYALEAIVESPIRDVYILGRRGPAEAKFTNVELREMGQLSDCAAIVDGSQLPDSLAGVEGSERDLRLKQKNLATLRGFVDADPAGKSKRVHFCFYGKPQAVLGQSKVSGLVLERTRLVDGRAEGTGQTFALDCGLVVAAIGTRSEPLEGVPFDEKRGITPNEEGRVADGLYAVGWIKRGPTGVIGTNKPDGEAVAVHIQSHIADSKKAGRRALEGLLKQRNVRWVDFNDWQAIDQAEIAAAREGAPRAKFVTVDELLAAANGLTDAAEIGRASCRERV